LPDSWDRQSCSTNGASIEEEGILKYYIERKLVKSLKEKIKGDCKDNFSLDLGQLLF
jgi:hypothetical protein